MMVEDLHAIYRRCDRKLVRKRQAGVEQRQVS